MKYEKGEFKSMIGDSVDIVVHMAKVGDISRKVHSIISVKGYDENKQDYIIINECVEG
jgi:Flp pilus assembly CpaF family ATPase